MTKATLIILYSLHVFWTGLWASISAQTLKQNAFWFCGVLGTVCLLGAYLEQTGKTKLARFVVAPTAALIFGFYLYSFVSDPAVDASYRVGLIIISSIAMLVTVLFPSPQQEN